MAFMRGLGLLLIVAMAGTAHAETRSCLPIAQLRDSNVVNGRAIDFTLRDRSVWRANLGSECPGLASARAFSYRTSQTQLCALDIITVIMPIGGSLTSGASCGLAPFERQPPPPPRP